MFEDLKKYKRIAVVGPHKSGTHAFAFMIANDTGHKVILEQAFTNTDVSKFMQILKEGENIVIQAPSMSNICHDINIPDTLVIFSMRDVDDIIASHIRGGLHIPKVGWYETFKRDHAPELNFDNSLAQIRYDAWEYQKELMKVPFKEIQYEDLSTHPLWVEPKDRWHGKGLAEVERFKKIAKELNEREDV